MSLQGQYGYAVSADFRREIPLYERTGQNVIPDFYPPPCYKQNFESCEVNNGYLDVAGDVPCSIDTACGSLSVDAERHVQLNGHMDRNAGYETPVDLSSPRPHKKDGQDYLSHELSNRGYHNHNGNYGLGVNRTLAHNGLNSAGRTGNST